MVIVIAQIPIASNFLKKMAFKAEKTAVLKKIEIYV
jgi:hypothetical protein